MKQRLGIAIALAGLLANPWILGWLFAPDGSIDGEARVRLIYFIDLFAMLYGVALIWPRRVRSIPQVFAPVAAALVAAAVVGTWWGIAAYRGAHHHTMDIAQMQPPTDEQRQWADQFVARCWDAARRHGWFNFQQAAADGFTLQWGDREHYVKRAFVFDDKVLDPDRPEFLMYRRTPRGDLLVGFMFFTRSLEERGPQPGGSLTPWHFHPWNGRGYCAEGGILPVSRPDDGGRCAQGVRVTRSAEMLHVWFVDHPLGPYADAMLFPDSASVVDPTLIHPMIVHFPIALLLVAVALDLLGRMFSKEALHSAALINLVIAGVAGLATIAAGMLAEVRLLIAHDVHRVLDTHKLLGFSASAGMVLLVAWRLSRHRANGSRPGMLYLAVGVLVAALTGAAGYFGSELVYVNGLAVQAIDQQALDRLERAIAGRTPGAGPAAAAAKPHVHGE